LGGGGAGRGIKEKVKTSLTRPVGHEVETADGNKEDVKEHLHRRGKKKSNPKTPTRIPEGVRKHLPGPMSRPYSRNRVQKVSREGEKTEKGEAKNERKTVKFSYNKHCRQGAEVPERKKSRKTSL